MNLEKCKSIILTIFKSIKDFLFKYKYIIFMILSFLILDFSLRYYTRSINFYNIYNTAPNLFTWCWIILMVGVSTSFKGKTCKTLYIISFIISIALFLTHSIYYAYFRNFFDFSSLHYASEAGEYLVDAIKNSPKWVFIITIISITLSYFACRWTPKRKIEIIKKGRKKIEKKERVFNYIYFIVVIVLFITLHLIAPTCLGKTTTEWDAWRKPRNVYNSFNDNNRSMQVAGFYEYNFKNFYVNYLKKEETKENEDLKLLEEKFSEEVEYSNKYTGMFKDKNVIFIQLESVDKFLTTKEIMPTLDSLRKNSINFTKHYSFVSGGGSTFNSEYMVNTGYTTPITMNKGAYTFSKNTYNYSLPNLLKREGYTVNAFHMNTPEYYSRDVNYKSFGYDSFNSLKIQEQYSDNNTYWLDTELINNEVFNNLIFNTEEKFANFIITYSAHMPFEVTKGVCSLLVEDTETELSEYECLKLQARETDNMIKLIMENLEEKELLDNTILVMYADHYLYTLNDASLLDQFKTTENNLINHTDFLIWSNGMKRKDIKEVTSQLNILPTVANLLGLEYHPNYYLMPDALGDNYKGLVFFSDYSWYDGNVYVDNGVVTNNKKISEQDLLEKNEYVNKLVKINDNVLTTDYFKNIKVNKKVETKEVQKD